MKVYIYIYNSFRSILCGIGFSHHPYSSSLSFSCSASSWPLVLDSVLSGSSSSSWSSSIVSSIASASSSSQFWEGHHNTQFRAQSKHGQAGKMTKGAVRPFQTRAHFEEVFLTVTYIRVIIWKSFITRGLLFIWWFCKRASEGNKSMSCCWKTVFITSIQAQTVLTQEWKKKRCKQRMVQSLLRFHLFMNFMQRGGSYLHFNTTAVPFRYDNNSDCGVGGRNVNMICWGYLPH